MQQVSILPLHAVMFHVNIKSDELLRGGDTALDVTLGLAVQSHGLQHKGSGELRLLDSRLLE